MQQYKKYSNNWVHHILDVIFFVQRSAFGFVNSLFCFSRKFFTTWYRNCYGQRWSRGHKARGPGQGHKKRPSTDPLEAKDQGHRRKCSQKKVLKIFFQAISKKKVFKIFFSGDLYVRKPKKKVFANFPRGFWHLSTKFQLFKNSAALEPRTGQFLSA